MYLEVACSPRSVGACRPENRDADLSGLNISSVHFVRPSVTNMWNQLNEHLNSTLYHCLNISGPPGTGKSCTLFAWVVYVGMRGGDHSKNVIWVHALASKVHVLRIVDGKATATTCSLGFLSALSECFEDYDVICLDGLLQEMKTLAFEAGRAGGKVVTCSFNRPGGFSSEAFMLVRSKDMTVYSWTLDEYKLCLENQLPGDAFKDEDNLLSHYYCSGGSMRLMQLDIELVRDFLKETIGQVANDMALLQGRWTVTVAGSMAVNTLIATVLLSQHVARLVAWSADDNFIAEAEKRLSKNPSWQDWVFEMKVIHMVKRDNKLTLRYVRDSTKTLKTKLPEKLQLNSSIASETFVDLPARFPEGNKWLFPGKWNHGCFDLVFYTESTLWFIQVTVGKSHSYKLHALLPVMDKLRHNGASCKLLVVKKDQDFKVIPSNVVKPNGRRNECSSWNVANIDIAELCV